MTSFDFTNEALQWQTEGFVLLDELVPRSEIVAALAEIATLTTNDSLGPLRRADQLGTSSATRGDSGGARFRNSQFDGTTLFPLPNCPALNRLFVHPAIVGFAKAALMTDELRLYQSRLWSKVGGHTNYEQPLHCDGNHSLVPTRSEPGFWFVEMFLYLSDVDEHNGAPRIVPLSSANGATSSRADTTRDGAPELYEAERPAPGAAGSLLAYRSDVWHRGTNLAEGTERHVAVLGFRPADLDWVGFDAHPPLVSSPDFVAFAERCSPEELALFGVPRPGHPYWTAETVAAMGHMYPALDLSPWRSMLTD